MITAIDPYCQGDLDSLCGVYAIINALCALCPEIDEDIAGVLFRHLARHMETVLKEPMPPLAYGIGHDGLRQLLDKAIRYVRKNLGIRIETAKFLVPSKGRELRTVWDLLTRELDHEHVAIIGTSGVSCHWTVAYTATSTTLRLLDSNGHKVLMRSRCTLKETQSRFQLSPSEIILLRRTSYE